MPPIPVHDSAILPIVAKYLMMSRGHFSAAASHAELSSAPAKVTSILKAAVPAGSLADLTSAGGIADLQLASTAFIDSLRTTSVFVALLNGGMTRAPLRTRINLSSTPAVGYLVSEGAGKPLMGLSLNAQIIPLLKAIAQLAVTDEVIRSSSDAAQTFLINELRRAAASAIDTAFFDVITDTNTPVIASNGASALDAGHDLKNLLATVPHHSTARFFFIAALDVATDAATLQDSTGQFVFPAMSPSGGEILGLETLVSGAVPAGHLFLIDAAGIAGDVELATIETSNEADLLMTDDASGGAATATSLFQTNNGAIRAAIWFGALRIRADAVAVLTTISWGPTVTT